MRSLAIALLAGFAISVSTLPVYASDAPTKVRQEMMKSVGKATKAGGAMLKGEADFDAAVAQAALADMHKVAEAYGDFFPVGSETGDETEASSKIWSDAEGWSAKLVKFEADTKAAVESAPGDIDAFKVAFGQVTANCKACHEGYRVKKD